MRTIASGLLLVLVVTQSVPARADSPAPSEWQVLQAMNPAVVNMWASAARQNADGAVSVNKTGGYINVGFQRESVDQIPAAVEHRDKKTLDNALQIISYALKHEHNDGGFDYAESNGVVSSGAAATALGEASAEAFFASDFGHTLRLLQESSWFKTSPDLNAERASVESFEEKAKPMAAWLVQHSQLLSTDRAALNRVFIYAAAYSLLGAAVGNTAAVSLGHSFLRQGLDRQESDGTLPEAGGFDSSYQAVSLYWLQVLYLQLGAGDPLHADLWKAIDSGAQRETKNILPDGTVSTANNTRVGSNGETYFGHKKQIDGRMVILSMNYWAATTGNPHIGRVAHLVFARYY